METINVKFKGKVWKKLFNFIYVVVAIFFLYHFITVKTMKIINVKFKKNVYSFEEKANDIWELLDCFEHDNIQIQPGFFTDFRTGPKFINWVIPKFSMAFVVHDFLYQTGKVTRKEADIIQDRMLKQDGNFNYVERKLIYLVVRAKGKKYWDYYRAGGTFPYKS
jgi:hypothetical protein